MYKLIINEKGSYCTHEYIFDDFSDMVTFAEVALKNADKKMVVTIELMEKEGDQNDGN